MLEKYFTTRKHALCAVCNERIENGDWVYIVPNATKNANGGKAFVHAGHAALADYHDLSVRRFCNPENFTGNLSKSGLLFGIELEVMARTDYPIEVDGVTIDNAETALAYIASVWRLRWTEDATVYAEGNMPPFTTMCGWRDRISNTLKVLAPNSVEAGAHLTVGFAYNRMNIPNFDYWTSIRVLDVLANVLVNASAEEREFVFGRDFTGYARYTDGTYNHGDWANIRSNGSIEFRLCHISNVEQYLRGASFCAEICKLIKAEEHKTSTDKGLNKKIQTMWKNAIEKKMAVDNRSVMIGTNRKRNIDK